MSGRPYGRAPRGGKSARKGKTVERRGRLTVRLRGRDDMPFSMGQLKQALFQLIRELEPHDACRVKNLAIYLTTVDASGQEVSLNGRAIWNIFPYRSAADELDRSADRTPCALSDRQAGQGDRPAT